MPSQSELKDIDIELLGNSFSQYLLLSCFSGGELWNDGTRPRPFRVKATNNVLHTRSIFRVEMNRHRTDIASWPLDRVENLAKLLFDWQGEHNVYAPISGFELWHEMDATKQIGRTLKSRDDWRRLWGGADAEAVEGEIRFQGGQLQQRVLTTPYLITPQDFRLTADSRGKGAGPDGKDLGADVDLIGPGSAYERWKETPEYQEWLEETKKWTITGSANSERDVKTELAKWQGEWENADYGRLVIDGERWSFHPKNGGESVSTIKIVEVTDKMTHVLLLSPGIDGKVHAIQTILRVDGDTLHNCGTIGSTRPTEFAYTPGCIYTQWKRVSNLPP
jgi:hypothetical protein